MRIDELSERIECTFLCVNSYWRLAKSHVKTHPSYLTFKAASFNSNMLSWIVSESECVLRVTLCSLMTVSQWVKYSLNSKSPSLIGLLLHVCNSLTFFDNLKWNYLILFTEYCSEYNSSETCQNITTSNTTCIWCANANTCIESNDEDTHKLKENDCRVQVSTC